MDIKNMGHTVLVAITILALEYELQSMAFLLTHRMDHNNITTPHACWYSKMSLSSDFLIKTY